VIAALLCAVITTVRRQSSYAKSPFWPFVFSIMLGIMIGYSAPDFFYCLTHDHLLIRQSPIIQLDEAVSELIPVFGWIMAPFCVAVFVSFFSAANPQNRSAMIALVIFSVLRGIAAGVMCWLVRLLMYYSYW